VTQGHENGMMYSGHDQQRINTHHGESDDHVDAVDVVEFHAC
jgi:hypothetical protein